MKRTLALLLACTVGLSLLSGCSGTVSCPVGPASSFAPPPMEPWDQLVSSAFLPASSPQVEGALANFGLALLKQTRTANGKKAIASDINHVPFSTLVSPLSVAMALSMAANGVDGNTLSQFQEVLGGGADIDVINAAWAQLVGDYHALGGSTQFSIANSLWKDHDGGIYEDFAAKCQGGYGAQIYEADLSDSRIADDVNRWVSQKTNKLIPQIIEEPFDEDTACLLINALYLKNSWEKEFDPGNTWQMEFHRAGGFTGLADFMQHNRTDLSYLKGEGVQGVVLPYDDGRLAFFSILPDDLYPETPGLGDWLITLEGDELVQIIRNRQDAHFFQFAMPKFEAEWKGNLEEILPGLGLEDAFLPGTANFSRLGNNPDGYYISQVIHAAKIEVNEKGTEAAAATAAAANAESGPMEEDIVLVLDRPFLYGIVDLQTNVPLFLGTYE